MTFGKITQVCGTLYRTELKPKGPLLSQTFIAASSSIAAGHRVLDCLESANCFGPNSQNMQRHEVYVARMSDLARRFPGKISGPWGCGMMFAFTPAMEPMHLQRAWCICSMTRTDEFLGWARPCPHPLLAAACCDYAAAYSAGMRYY